MNKTKQLVNNIRSGLLFALASSLALTAVAETASTDMIIACRDLSEDAARLACYDETVGAFQMAEKAGDVRTFTKEEVTEERKRNFGLAVPSFNFGKSDSEQEEIKKILLKVVAVERGPYDKLVLTLENGQIWEQTDSKRVSTRNISEAEIRRAALGSYKIKLGKNPAFRAKRVK